MNYFSYFIEKQTDAKSSASGGWVMIIQIT